MVLKCNHCKNKKLQAFFNILITNCFAMGPPPPPPDILTFKIGSLGHWIDKINFVQIFSLISLHFEYSFANSVVIFLQIEKFDWVHVSQTLNCNRKVWKGDLMFWWSGKVPERSRKVTEWNGRVTEWSWTVADWSEKVTEWS